jgi:hypothetical protein
MVNYNAGQIYAIWSPSHPEAGVYYGSTCQGLSTRIQNHRTSFVRYLKGLYGFCSAYHIIKYPDFKYKTVIFYPCSSKKELHREEGRQIQINKDSCNQYIAGRTKKEWREANVDDIKEKQHLLSIKNKDEKKDYDKKYQIKNKKKLNQISRDYRINNLEILKEKGKQYRNDNKQLISEKNKKYRVDNAEKIKERKAQWYQDNKEAMKVKRAHEYQENKQAISEKSKIRIVCPCGISILKIRKKRHELTLKHKNNLPK